MAKSKFTFILFILLFINTFLQAQKKHYFVFYLTDKANNTFTISDSSTLLTPASFERRKRENIKFTAEDLPVSKFYTDSLTKLGYSIWLKSKWLNAIVIQTDSSNALKINKLIFVRNYFPLGKNSTFNNLTYCEEKMSTPNYGSSQGQNNMLGINNMHAKGYVGQGKKIAVFDGGFQNANNLNVFDSLFKNNQIKFTYNVTDNNKTSVYNGHYHGTNVLSLMGGYTNGSLIGGAYKADYFLFETEITESESKLEEFNWLVAAEMADSLGADLINSSLGYFDFDNAALNYTFSDFDGKTSLIAQAANLATAKGILVVSSAGNERASYWKKISTPADSPNVIAVGAVDISNVIGSFSSPGPSADGRIKPDISAPGVNVTIADAANNFISGSGTSFAAPMLTGLLAGFWSGNPQLKMSEIKAILIESGDKYNNPNNDFGHGVPSFVRMQNFVLGLNQYNQDTIFAYFLPASDKITIKSTENNLKEALLVGIDGKIWIQKNLQGIEDEINTTQLPNGIYIIKIVDLSNKSLIAKIVVNR